MHSPLHFFNDPVVISAAKAALAILFLTGGWQKLRDPIVFRGAVENYELIPTHLVPLVAYALPIIEVALGILLLIPRASNIGGLGSMLLLTVMTAVATISLLRGRFGIDCGCGGLSSQPLSWSLIMRNVVLIGFAGIAMQQDTDRILNWLDFFLTAATSLSLLGLYVSINQLMSNAPLAVKRQDH